MKTTNVSSTQQKNSTSYKDWLHRHLPREIVEENHPETLRKAFFLQYASIFLGVSVLLVLAAIHLLLVPNKQSLDALDLSTTICCFILFGNVILMRYTRTLLIPSLVFVLGAASSLSIVTLTQGGLISPIQAIKGSAIPIALFLLGVRKGLLFTLLLFVDLGVHLYLAENTNVFASFPSYVQTSEFAFAAYIVQLSGLFVIAWIFESSRLQAQKALEASYSQNFEMEVARDAAIQANRAKSMFLANMSHELRTPLNAIIGYAELLREEAEEMKLQHFMDDAAKIHRSGNHLLEIINDILDLSVIESGRVELKFAQIEIDPFLHNLREAIEPLLAKNHNTFHLDVHVENDTIEVAPKRLQQVLINLLGNATKFTEKGKITLEVRSEEIDTKPWILFAVHDTGIGMPPEQMAKIFQKFTQIDNSFSRRYEGTGLGLAICKELCEAMGGSIEVESELDKGTTFSVWLPLETGHSLFLEEDELEYMDEAGFLEPMDTRSLD